ncbi:hypothetical protein ABTP00_18845, partial [Acinetobacter baumannii]
DFLRDYQNAAYASRYRAAVDRVRHAEAALGGDRNEGAPPPPQAGEANRARGQTEQNPNDLPLTDAVARSLFKLMAYKDEY